VAALTLLVASAQTASSQGKNGESWPALEWCDRAPCYYPQPQLFLRMTATCSMKVNVTEFGAVSAVEGSCDMASFLPAARTCAMRQRFRPARENGVDVPRSGHPVIINFVLPGAPKSGDTGGSRRDCYIS